jgi:hypothetical protein
MFRRMATLSRAEDYAYTLARGLTDVIGIPIAM